jgi:hypothetical protein
MVTTIEDLREQIRHEERVAGLRADGYVSRVAIQRRRVQIGLLLLLVFLGLAASTAADDLGSGPTRDAALVDPGLIRAAMIVFAVGFAAYVIEKERHLKRLSHLELQAEEFESTLADRLLGAAAVAEAGLAVCSTLDLGAVLDSVLARALAMLGASLGSVSLLTDGGELQEAAARAYGKPGSRPLPVPESLLMQVALAREPQLVSGAVPLDLTASAPRPARAASVMCVPLEHGEDLLGVIAVGAAPGQWFDHADLETLRRFACPAAAAVGNARRYEAALYQVDWAGRTTTAALRHELHDVSASLHDAVGALRGGDLDQRQRAALLDRVETGARRIRALTC